MCISVSGMKELGWICRHNIFLSKKVWKSSKSISACDPFFLEWRRLLLERLSLKCTSFTTQHRFSVPFTFWITTKHTLLLLPPPLPLPQTSTPNNLQKAIRVMVVHLKISLWHKPNTHLSVSLWHKPNLRPFKTGDYWMITKPDLWPELG